MSGKPPTMTRRRWVWHNLGTIAHLAFAVNFTAGWARFLMGDHVGLPWPLYPVGAVVFLWAGIQRMIEDATGDK